MNDIISSYLIVICICCGEQHERHSAGENDVQRKHDVTLEGTGNAGTGCANSSHRLTDEMRLRRKEIRKVAKSTLTGVMFGNPKFEKPIVIKNKGIKEWIDQPFAQYLEKNEALLNIGYLIANALYLGWKKDIHSEKFIAHIFETCIGGYAAWIIVRESYNGECFIHSVTDLEAIKKGIHPL